MEIIYIIFVGFSIFAIAFPKSKVIACLTFLFIWLLWGWNSWNGDYDAYKTIYDASISPWLSPVVTEAGFNYFNKLFNLIGLQFQEYMQIVSACVLIIIFIFIVKYCPFPAICSIIYVIIFVLEYVYTRTYITHSLLILAIVIYFSGFKYYKVSFIILIVFSFFIHRTAILFLPFYFVLDRDKVFDMKKVLLLCSLIVAFSILFFGRVIVPMLGGDVMNKFNAYETGGGFTTISFAHVLIVFLVVYIIKRVLTFSKLNSDTRKVLIFIINFNLISLFYLSLYYHVPYFGRFIRVLITIDLVFILYSIQSFQLIKDSINVVRSRIIFFVVLLTIAVMFYKSTLSLTYYPLLKKNLIFGEEYYVPDFTNK